MGVWGCWTYSFYVMLSSLLPLSSGSGCYGLDPRLKQYAGFKPKGLFGRLLRTVIRLVKIAEFGSGKVVSGSVRCSIRGFLSVEDNVTLHERRRCLKSKQDNGGWASGDSRIVLLLEYPPGSHRAGHPGGRYLDPVTTLHCLARVPTRNQPV